MNNPLSVNDMYYRFVNFFHVLYFIFIVYLFFIVTSQIISESTIFLYVIQSSVSNFLYSPTFSTSKNPSNHSILTQYLSLSQQIVFNGKNLSTFGILHIHQAIYLHLQVFSSPTSLVHPSSSPSPASRRHQVTRRRKHTPPTRKLLILLKVLRRVDHQGPAAAPL